MLWPSMGPCVIDRVLHGPVAVLLEQQVGMTFQCKAFPCGVQGPTKQCVGLGTQKHHSGCKVAAARMVHPGSVPQTLGPCLLVCIQQRAATRAAPRFHASQEPTWCSSTPLGCLQHWRP